MTAMQKQADKAARREKGGVRHSAYYHRYFSGYTEVRTELPNNRFHTERIYTAPWKRLAGTDKRWNAVKWLYALLALGAAALHVFALTRPLSANSAWYAVLGAVAATVVLPMLLYAVIEGACRKRLMTMGECMSVSKRLIWVSKAEGIFFATTALGMLIHLFVDFGNAAWATLGCAALEAVAAVLVCGVWIMESRAVYIDVPNETILPAGEAHVIN